MICRSEFLAGPRGLQGGLIAPMPVGLWCNERVLGISRKWFRRSEDVASLRKTRSKVKIVEWEEGRRDNVRDPRLRAIPHHLNLA